VWCWQYVLAVCAGKHAHLANPLRGWDAHGVDRDVKTAALPNPFHIIEIAAILAFPICKGMKFVSIQLKEATGKHPVRRARAGGNQWYPRRQFLSQTQATQ